MLILQVLVLSFASLVICSSRMAYFETFRNQEPVNKTVLNITSVRNILQCASSCSGMQGCNSFLFAGVFMECELLDANIVNGTDLIAGISIFAKLRTSSANLSTTSEPVATTTTSDPVATTTTSGPVATTTTPVPVATTTTPVAATTTPVAATTTPVATTTTPVATTTTPVATTTTPVAATTTPVAATTTPVPVTPEVIDMVYGVSMMCQDTSNSGPNDDLLVLTTAGVYIYDTILELAVGPCNGPLEFTTVFHGIPNMPATPSNVRGLSFTGTNIELYADDNTVYKWQATDVTLKLADIPSETYFEHMSSHYLDDVDFQLASIFKVEIYDVMVFDIGNSTICAGLNLPDKQACFDKHNPHFVDVPLLGEFDVNPFQTAPADVIAADITDGTNVVFIDSTGNVYEGQHDTVEFVLFGTIKF